MYTKIIIASLFQAAVARHFLNQNPFFLYTGQQFNFRNPDSESFQVHSHHGTPDFSDYRAYPDENHSRQHYERYVDHNSNVRETNLQQNDQVVRNNEHVNTEHKVENSNRRSSHHHGHDQNEPHYTNTPEDNSNSNQHHDRSNNGNNNRAASRTNNHAGSHKHATLKTNLDSHHNHDTNAGRRTEHDSENTAHRQKGEGETRTNDNTQNVRSRDQYESNPEISQASRGADTRVASDNLSEVRNNGDTMIFADNPKPITSVKTSTDNEVGHKKGEPNDEDQWVWSTVPTTPAAIITPLPDGELDDRVSFAGDGCPKGEAKVLGECVKKH